MEIERRRLGRTGMDTTIVGCGGVAIGSFHADENVPEQSAIDTIRHALDVGVNYLDTSPLYKDSERRFGLALQAVGGLPAGAYLSTKTGTHPDHRGDYSAATTRWSVENSLRLLGRDAVDLVLVHDPQSMEPVLARGGAVDELERMRGEGKLRSIGLGCRPHDFHRQAIRDGRFDAILTFADYNLVRQTAAPLIDEAHAAGVGVIVAQVVLAGSLAGPDPLENPHTKNRPDAPAAHEWWRWAREREVPLQAVAIQWVLRNPRVSTILIGPKTPDEVEQNVRMATMPLPEGIWAEVDERIAREVGVNS
jgi:aryl-alcohol dehydrogenase-like predicted oxidoreductase